MKVCFLPHLCLAVLLASTATASILTEAKNVPQERSLTQLKDDVFEIIDKELKTASAKYTISLQRETCGKYDPKDKNSQFSVCLQSYDEATNTISLQFRSPNNHFELEFANIDLKEPTNDIKIESYVEEYAKSFEDLAIDAKDRFASIKEGLEKAATELAIADMTVPSLTPVDGQPLGAKITYTYQGKANEISLQITGDIVTFLTPFFTDTIDLNIPLKNFIVFEVKKMAKEIIVHLYQMQRFALSDGDSAAQSIKTLTCEKIMAGEEFKTSFADRMQKNELTADFSGTTLTISKGDKNVKVTCSVVNVSEFNLLEVKADFTGTSGSIQPLTQAYLEKSLYNLEPISVAFFHDLGTFVIRLLADRNVEEEFEPLAPNAPAAGN